MSMHLFYTALSTPLPKNILFLLALVSNLLLLICVFSYQFILSFLSDFITFFSFLSSPSFLTIRTWTTLLIKTCTPHFFVVFIPLFYGLIIASYLVVSSPSVSHLLFQVLVLWTSLCQVLYNSVVSSFLSNELSKMHHYPSIIQHSPKWQTLFEPLSLTCN